MALRAALALADVCTMNFLVIIFYEVVTQGIDIDGVTVSISMLRAYFTKGGTLTADRSEYKIAAYPLAIL
jgi:hypothetical protein